MTSYSLSTLVSGNRFHYDCAMEGFLKWLSMNNVTFLSSAQDYKCEFPVFVYNLPLLEFSTIMDSCEDEKKAIESVNLALFIFSAILVFTIVLDGITYAHLRG